MSEYISSAAKELNQETIIYIEFGLVDFDRLKCQFWKQLYVRNNAICLARMTAV